MRIWNKNVLSKLVLFFTVSCLLVFISTFFVLTGDKNFTVLEMSENDGVLSWKCYEC
jgi:hypothetical protein